MEFQSFTKNYEDMCTEAGFQFVFKCDLCGDGYKTKFVESKSYGKLACSTVGKGIQAGRRRRRAVPRRQRREPAEPTSCMTRHWA